MYICIYICVCVCVCLFVNKSIAFKRNKNIQDLIVAI